MTKMDASNGSTQEVFSIINDISEMMTKASALIQVALGDDFLNCTRKIQYHYLWALSDFIENAQSLCEKIDR